MYKNKIAFLMACVLLASCGPRAPKTYPAAGRTDVYDVFYGDTVEDPYRWMENDTSAEVASWVREENALTRSYLDAIPFRAALKERLTDLYNYEKAGAPMKRNGKYYFFRNDGLQNQSVLRPEYLLGRGYRRPYRDIFFQERKIHGLHHFS
jgi:prolyl oligopeptidase